MALFPQYAPEFSLAINGQPLPSAVRSAVTSVRYEDGLNASDRVEVGLANPDLHWLQTHILGLGFRPFLTAVRLGPIGGLSAVPEGTFDIDNKLALSLGYAPDPLEEVFKGEVTGLQVSFPSGGMPTMTLVAHDYLNRLNQGSYARGFGFLPDAIVAAILGAENLLIPLIDPVIVAGSTALAVLDAIFKGTGVKQGGRDKGESDFELLKRIAERYDADFWVEGDTLYLARFIPKEYSPRLTLTWGESLIDFSPRMSTVGQVLGVSAKFTLREIPLSFLVAVFWDFDRESLGIKVVPGEAVSFTKSLLGDVLTIIDQPITNPADIAGAALMITRMLRQKINNRVTGSGSAVGNAKIRAGAMIRLEGLGVDFSGDYRVTSASHTLDSGGWRTSFQVQKEILP